MIPDNLILVFSPHNAKGFLFFFFFKTYFDVDHFKVFLEFVTILFLGFFFFFLAMRHVGSQLSSQGLNLQPLYWKAKSSPLDCQGSP